MTTEEFNEKYKDYLEPGFEGLALSNQQAIKLLDERFQEWIKRPNFQYAQIKYKFGSIRVYAEPLTIEEMVAIEKELEKFYI